MKPTFAQMKLRIFAGFALLLTLFNSCKTDLDILANYKAIPVVYGILNPRDSVHYIRIQKAFLGAGDAYVFSQNPDSNYFKNITVKLIPFKINQVSGDSIFKSPKEIILSETYINDKESGVFFSGNQKLFATTAKLDSSFSLLLKIYNNENGEVYSASTPLINGTKISYPNPGTQGSFGFASQLGTYVNSKATWNLGENGYFSELTLVVNYKAVYLNQSGVNDTIEKAISWKQTTINITQFNNQTSVEQALPGEGFYKFIEEAIPNPGDTLVRIFTGIDVIADVGSYDFYNFYNLNQPSTTIVQDRPVYTNITGGYGVFASRSRSMVLKRLLNSASTKELMDGQHTSALKFKWP